MLKSPTKKSKSPTKLGKFYPQIDVVPLDRTPERKKSINRSPSYRPEIVASPKTHRLTKNEELAQTNKPDLPEFLEADIGLYSKFKSTHIHLEYSIYDPKLADEKENNASMASASRSVTQVTNDEVVLNATPEKNEATTTDIYGLGYTISVLLTIFTVEFGKNRIKIPLLM